MCWQDLHHLRLAAKTDNCYLSFFFFIIHRLLLNVKVSLHLKSSQRTCSDQSRLIGLRMFESNDLQSQRLLHFGHVSFTRSLQQRVTFELIYIENNDKKKGT